ncbi:hypothetical protein ATE67_14720 [Sphingopyxis sp. H050]|nr:hypothetical protein ATE67_14720 [Sphingopyxis sp. H050]
MMISFPYCETMPFIVSMAWDMTGTAVAAAEGPQAKLEDGAARLFCSARKAACAPAERAHSLSPNDTLSLAGLTMTPPSGQRVVTIGK